MSDKFTIENTAISFRLDELETDEIIINSVPYNYTVSFVDAARLSTIINEIAALNGNKHFVFIDAIVGGLYLEQFFKAQELHEIAAEEDNKVLPTVTGLLDKLLAVNFTKKEMFLSVGGGITQDVSAFARAVYKRGIDWTYLPTTLLAMGDSCIGAKSCLNYGNTKNPLGLFSAPKKVYIYDGFLNTLKSRDVLSGYGEILKLAIVGGEAAVQKFEDLTQHQQGDPLHNINKLIKLSLLIKKAVIEVDEFENNIRKALNYGHTIGHAIEPLVNYQIPHGIAISIGMMIENLLASEFGTLPKNETSRLNKLIMQYVDKASLQQLAALPIDELIKAMKRDKKALSDDIYLAVPEKIGHFNMLKIPADARFEQFLKHSIASL